MRKHNLAKYRAPHNSIMNAFNAGIAQRYGERSMRLDTDTTARVYALARQMAEGAPGLSPADAVRQIVAAAEQAMEPPTHDAEPIALLPAYDEAAQA